MTNIDIDALLVDMIEDHECITTTRLAQILARKAQVREVKVPVLRARLLDLARDGRIYLASRGWDQSLAFAANGVVEDLDLGARRSRYEDAEPWHMSAAERHDYMSGAIS